MDTGMKTLEEKVAFLEDSVTRLARTVEEMNLQLVGVMKEVHIMRRTRSTADQVDPEDSEHTPHY